MVNTMAGIILVIQSLLYSDCLQPVQASAVMGTIYGNYDYMYVVCGCFAGFAILFTINQL